MVELLQQAVEVAAHPLVLADPEDLSDFVGGEAKDSQLAGALEILWIGKWRRKMKLRQYSTGFRE